MTAAAQPPLRDRVGQLLRVLRGDVSRSAVARRLGTTRQSVMKVEEGSVSLDRLDVLAETYGVEFHLIAVDRQGFTWNTAGPTAPPGARTSAAPRCAAGLADLEAEDEG